MHALCGLWLYKHDFEVMKYISMSSPLVQYQDYNHLSPYGQAALRPGDYKPDIALVA